MATRFCPQSDGKRDRWLSLVFIERKTATALGHYARVGSRYDPVFMDRSESISKNGKIIC